MNTEKQNKQTDPKDLDMTNYVRTILESTSDAEVSTDLQPDIDLSLLESLGAKVQAGKKNMKFEDYKVIYQKLNEAAAMAVSHPELEDFTRYLTMLGSSLKKVMFS